MQSRKSRSLFIALFSLSLCCGGLLNSSFPAYSADQRVLPLSGNTIADLAEKAIPAVVHIEMRRKVSMGMPPGFPSITEFFFNGQKVPNLFGGLPDEGGSGKSDPNKKNSPPAEMPQQFTRKPDIASGFIIRSDGYILTNAHAVDGQDAIKVVMSDKRSYDANVVGIDYFSDLAVIKIDAKNLPTLPWGASSNLRPGEFAVAIGSPLGDDHSVTLGIISAVGRTESDVNGNINFIQTDAAINPGNSGGPLMNLNGEVVGVNTAIRPLAQNIAYSIPADIAQTVSTELINSGEIARPWLGVQMSELDEAYIKGTGLPADTKGVVIRGFIQGSPAQASGLKLNDIIQKIDGKEMKAPIDVKEYVQARKSGDVLNFIVLRSNKVETVVVNVGKFPNNKVNPKLRMR